MLATLHSTAGGRRAGISKGECSPSRRSVDVIGRSRMSMLGSGGGPPRRNEPAQVGQPSSPVAGLHWRLVRSRHQQTVQVLLMPKLSVRDVEGGSGARQQLLGPIKRHFGALASVGACDLGVQPLLQMNGDVQYPAAGVRQGSCQCMLRGRPIEVTRSTVLDRRPHSPEASPHALLDALTHVDGYALFRV